MKTFSVFLLLNMAIACFADYEFQFSGERSLLREMRTWKASPEKISWNAGILKTNDVNATFYIPGKTGNGRFTLSGRDCYRSRVGLVAHATADFRSFYELEIFPSGRRVFFRRWMNGTPAVRHEFLYDGGNNFTLDLDFNGRTIFARVNGEKVAEFPDDGLLRTGYSGIRCGYWTNMEIKSFSHSEKIPVSPVSAKNASTEILSRVKKIEIAKRRDWDLSKAFRKENGLRSTVSLNQIWAFQPVFERNAPGSNWGYFVVPGYWAKGAIGNYMRTSGGEAVSRWRGIRYSSGGVSAWYRRTCVPPENWKNKKIELVLEDVCGTAEIFLGTKKIAAKTDSECGVLRIDVSGKLRCGENNEISILSASKRQNPAGLGNVYFQTSPQFNFGRPEIETKVSDGALRVSFAGNSVPEKSTLTAAIRDRNGKLLFQEKRAFSEKMLYFWKPPVLWTPDTPELYFLEMSLRGADGNELDRSTIRFGFREFSARNGGFFLNGNPIVLKAETAVRQKGSWWGLDACNDPVYMKPLFASYKALNLNCTYLPGPPSESVLELADEMGIMVLVKGRILGHPELDCDTENAMKRLEKSLMEMKNNPVYSRHPSQIGFLIDVWYGYNAGCTNPNYIGQPKQDPNRKNGIPAIREQRLNRMVSLYRKYFPDMECFTGGSGAVGRIYGTHVYHTWGAPSTELRALFEDWSKKREYPIFVGETYLPYIGSFFDLKNFHGGGTPFVLENSARILGSDAYHYRTSLSPRPFHERSSSGWFWNTSEKKKNGKFGFPVDSATAVVAKYIDEIMPGWRYHRLTGYGNFDYAGDAFAQQRLFAMPDPSDYSDFTFKPEAFDNGNARCPSNDPGAPGYDLRPTLLSAPFARAMGKIGAAVFDKSADPLLQNHSGYGGETLEKSVILFNDTPETVRFRLELSLSDNQNRRFPLGEKTVSAPPFEQVLVPVRIPLPATLNRSEWVFHAVLHGKETIRMNFPIQSFARSPELKTASAVYLFDPESLLAQKLSKRLAFHRLNETDSLPEKGILIVGRGALSKWKKQPDWSAAAAKGLNILFMEQFPESSPELMKTRSRRVFINAPAHPVFFGLKDVDFEYWQDSHSIAPAKVRNGAGTNWADWGNRNMVASYVFRRPQHGNLISLLVSGFDLYQTPLLECRTGNGLWIASQLEITERLGTDPAATRLFENLIAYLDRPSGRKTTLFFGGSNGKRLMEQFRTDCRSVNELSSETLRKADVLIVSSPDWERLKPFRMALNDFVYFGGKILYLHTGKTFDPSWLPFTMGLSEQNATRASLSGEADGTWLNGFHNSELYWRTPRRVPVFTQVPPHFNASVPAVLVRGKFGAGEWIFTTLTPDRFGPSPAMGKTVRLLSALFTSLGVNIPGSVFPFAESAPSRMLDLSEYKWEFATDEKNIGLQEGWHFGNGSARWLKGLIADGVEVRVGQPFETFLQRDYDGYAWYRLTFDVPDELRNAPDCYFSAGAIDDTDEVYLNGVRIGSTDKETPKYWESPRNYRIPRGLLKKNENRIAIRVFDEKGSGGIVKGPVAISSQKIGLHCTLWKSPWPDGARRDYDYNPDLVRQY